MRDLDKLFFVLLVIGGLILLAIARDIGSAIGADTGPVFQALLFLILITATVCFVGIKFSLDFIYCISSWAIFAWPCTFVVLDNIASKSIGARWSYSEEGFSTWYSSGFFQYGIEAALIALLVVVFFRRQRA